MTGRAITALVPAAPSVPSTTPFRWTSARSSSSTARPSRAPPRTGSARLPCASPASCSPCARCSSSSTGASRCSRALASCGGATPPSAPSSTAFGETALSPPRSPSAPRRLPRRWSSSRAWDRSTPTIRTTNQRPQVPLLAPLSRPAQPAAILLSLPVPSRRTHLPMHALTPSPFLWRRRRWPLRRRVCIRHSRMQPHRRALRLHARRRHRPRPL